VLYKGTGAQKASCAKIINYLIIEILAHAQK
jgi:hypothetical protein